MVCVYVLLSLRVTLAFTKYQYSHLPNRVSLRSWAPRLLLDMPPLGATGGWQVAAGRGGPWWWCWDYNCTTITSSAHERQLCIHKQDPDEGAHRRVKRLNYCPNNRSGGKVADANERRVRPDCLSGCTCFWRRLADIFYQSFLECSKSGIFSCFLNRMVYKYQEKESSLYWRIKRNGSLV